ncbi:MAG: hypothetical protein CL602_10090 [Alteromonas sp.]|uniref:Uncharacterized protein n=2 Tax=Alteromonas australica TaxID=589873 RepID=A0A358DTZ6_9ALTE|nr:hypothetical protein [Alteromonas sp.]HAU27194.1 hypothetical protein [Alteromonas australica]HBU49687.1 hypothetical protein [Alteromonas australica]|tara:strand:+ start:22701 stop:23003 length:303 start_codon:yes stop_codon:yes gene_type:complete
MRYGAPLGGKRLKLTNLIAKGASMKTMDFIKRAKKVEFADIARSAKPIEQTTLKHVRPTDKCYVVKAGSKLQFWITRDDYLLSVNVSLHSPFCVCTDADS